MKVCILYRPNSEHARKVEEYSHDFSKTHGKEVQLVNLNTREGAATATLYDVVQYPAVLALKDDGELMKYWEGGQLPLMDELAFYAS